MRGCVVFRKSFAPALCIGALTLVGACSEPNNSGGGVVRLDTSARDGAGQAHLAGGGAAPLYLSWQEPTPDGATALRVAQFTDDGWSGLQTIAEGTDWFINWADFPSVVPISSESVIAHWLTLKPDRRYAYDITYAVSADAGNSWSQPQILNADNTVAEHGFVSFFPWNDGLGAVWLDGRAIAALTIDELFELEEPIGMTLRFARMNQAGAVLERGEIDDLVCDCCQTDAVSTADGPLIVYRDRTITETRDIAVRRGTLGVAADNRELTAIWSDPTILGPDGWVIDGCPVNGPAVGSNDEHIAVAWFTAADNRPRLQFARSINGGREFAAASTLSADAVLGQADVAVSSDGTAWVSAWHRAAGGMELRVHRVALSGNAVATRVVASTAAPLPTDVPQMALHEDQLVFAWSEIGNPGQLYSAVLPLWHD